MYISERIDRRALRRLRSAGRYLPASVGVALFGAVYEHFSHDVWSFYMVYAFAFPLVLGALPEVLAALHPVLDRSTPLSRTLRGAGIWTLTIGAIFRGILEIYGTTNRLGNVYWIAGALLLAASLAAVLRGILLLSAPE